MKTKILSLIAAVALLPGFAACEQEEYTAPVRPAHEEEEPGEDDPHPGDEEMRVVSLEAVIEAAVPETRTSVARDGGITWNESDSIGIRTSAGKWASFRLDSSAGFKKGMFIGELAKDETLSGYAVHPYAEGVSLENGTLTLPLPEIPDGQIPMASAVDGENALQFRILTGALLISAGVLPDGASSLVVEADRAIAGMLTADLSSFTASLPADGAAKVAFPVNHSQHEFVLPLPEGGYTLSAWFENEGTEIEDSRMEIGSIDIERGSMLIYEQGEIVAITDLYLTAEGAGRHNGKNWNNAFSVEDLSAIFTGQTSEENIARYAGATVHVAGGTYKPVASLNFDFTKSASDVHLTFLGGYDPQTGVRNPASNPTVFDGEASESGRFARFDLRSHIVFEDMAFNGFGSGTALFYLWTGASNKNIDITFRRCSFKDNKTDAATNGVVYGGVFFVRGGFLKLESCTFDGNSAERGGAVACLGDGKLRVSGTDMEPTIFKGSSSDTGGALYVENTTGEVNISHARFQGNEATRSYVTWAAGGAVSIMRNSATGTMAVSFTDCAFEGNKASGACGGAIGLYNAEQKSLNLTRCRFEDNECLSRGGALFTDSGKNGKDIYHITDCEFIGNKVIGGVDKTGYGGAFDVQDNFKGTMYVDGCEFRGNTAPLGGAAWANYNNGMVCSIFFNACKFHGNYVGNSTGANGTVFICSGYAGFHNCAFWDNYKEGQTTPRDIMVSPNGSATSLAYVLLSNCTIHQGGGNACLYLNATTIRTNVVNSVLATAGYPVSIKTSPYAAGSTGEHVLQIGKSNAFHTAQSTGGILLGYDAWKDKITDGYVFTGNLTEAGFIPMTESSSAYISALGLEQDHAFDSWLTGIGAYSRDIDGNFRSVQWSPGCVQTASGSSAPAHRVTILGDSISTYDGFLSGSPVRPHYPRGDVQDVTQTWWHQLIYKKMTNSVLEGNFAYSGSQVARATNTNYLNTTWYGQGFVEKALRDGIGSPDVVFIFGGTNDYMHGETTVFPGGEIVKNETSSPSSAILEGIFATADAAATRAEVEALPDTDFCSAYAKLIRLVKTLRPEAAVVCIIGDILNAPVQQSILAIAAHYNCRVVDFFAAAGYNDETHIPKIDAVHPNSTGMSYICDKIYSETKDLFE